MRITTWTEYSLIISIHLARRGQTQASPVAARELAETERLPADYVERLFAAFAGQPRIDMPDRAALEDNPLAIAGGWKG